MVQRTYRAVATRTDRNSVAYSVMDAASLPPPSTAAAAAAAAAADILCRSLGATASTTGVMADRMKSLQVSNAHQHYDSYADRK